MTSKLEETKRQPWKAIGLMFALLLVVCIDYAVVANFDHFVYKWPGRMSPYVVPLWTSLPRFTYYVVVGYLIGRLLKLGLLAAAAFLISVLVYYAFLRFGTYYVYGGLFSYFVAYLPVASVPIAFVLGYSCGRRLGTSVTGDPGASSVSA